MIPITHRLTPVNIVLIGMRGVGKTNIARRLSFATKRPVMSTDVLVEYELGAPIPQIVGPPCCRIACQPVARR